MLKRLAMVVAIYFFFQILGCGPEGKVYTIDIDYKGMDAVLNLPNSHKNYGFEKEINIYCDSVNGKKYINRGVFSFNIEEVIQKKVDSAFLLLYFNNSSGLFSSKSYGHSGNIDLIIEKVSETWEEDKISWKRYPKIGTKKLFFEAAKNDNTQDFMIDVTEFFLENHHKEDISFLVRLKNEELGNYIHLTNKEYSGYLKKPKLKIYAKK